MPPGSGNGGRGAITTFFSMELFFKILGEFVFLSSSELFYFLKETKNIRFLLLTFFVLPVALLFAK